MERDPQIIISWKIAINFSSDENLYDSDEPLSLTNEYYKEDNSHIKVNDLYINCRSYKNHTTYVHFRDNEDTK